MIKLDTIILEEIAYKVKLKGIHIKAFIYFVQIRFRDHPDKLYIEEWAERIRDGKYVFGDSESRKAIKEGYSKAFEDIETWIKNDEQTTSIP